MVERFLTNTQIHALLRDRGHTFWSRDPAAAPVDVSPSPEMAITVALEADATLKPAYRQRYFVTVQNEDGEPPLLHDSAFALQEPVATAAALEPTNNYFTTGPLRWLLVRIKRFEQVLLWPKGGFHGPDGLGYLVRGPGGVRIDPAPHLVRWFERHTREHMQIGAAVLSLSELCDCQVLWEAAHLVGLSCYDFFVSDTAGHEVYQLHHRDKVIVSIPDARSRWELLKGLAGCDKLFEDWSGYWSEEEFGS